MGPLALSCPHWCYVQQSKMSKKKCGRSRMCNCQGCLWALCHTPSRGRLRALCHSPIRVLNCSLVSRLAVTSCSPCQKVTTVSHPRVTQTACGVNLTARACPCLLSLELLLPGLDVSCPKNKCQRLYHYFCTYVMFPSWTCTNDCTVL